MKAIVRDVILGGLILGSLTLGGAALQPRDKVVRSDRALAPEVQP